MDLQEEGQQDSWNYSTLLPLQAENPQHAGKSQGLLAQSSANPMFLKQPLGLFEAPAVWDPCKQLLSTSFAFS